MPDSIQLIFGSSIRATAAGSQLYVDDITMDFATGINQHLTANGTFANAFPNPAQNEITLSMPNDNAKYAKVFDISGRMVGSFELVNQKVTVDLSSYEKGTYMYIITDAKENKLHSDKFNVVK